MEYTELAVLADRVLEMSGDDDERVAEVLDTIDPVVRNELLLSDFLNAYQVFYFFFRIRLQEELRDRLILTPASDVGSGIMVEELDLYQIIFLVRKGVPLACVSDGKHLIATFTGQESYHQARTYIEEHL